MPPKVPRIEVECATCGTKIEKYPAAVAQSKTKRFFCSTQCRGKLGSKPKTVPRKSCEQCGKEFVSYGGKPGRFCSKPCYDAWQRRGRIERVCEQCGKEFERPPSFESRQVARFCSRGCEAASRIKRPLGREHNGRPAALDTAGYVRVFEPEHPHAYGGWVFEHRLVVERELGRHLEPDEHVHHVNGIKGDNRLENLKVMSHSQHSVITWNERQAKVDAIKAELAEYRRRFGPL
jgi:endogenous inhibitor of DNA gyrase (YacG/DUF329 family)